MMSQTRLDKKYSVLRVGRVAVQEIMVKFRELWRYIIGSLLNQKQLNNEQSSKAPNNVNIVKIWTERIKPQIIKWNAYSDYI